jgi:hypothetical protein
MLFRDESGNLVIINRSDYKNDAIYYKKIASIKGGCQNHQSTPGAGSIDRMMSLVEKSVR